LKIFQEYYSTVVIIALGTVVCLLWWGVDPMDVNAYESLRIEQIHQLGHSMETVVEMDFENPGFLVSDYFEEYGGKYIYRGGISEASWEVGQSYNREEITDFANNHFTEIPFYSLTWRGGNCYINVDRVEAPSVREFLQTVDGMGLSQIDTLIVDLRFLRKVEWGSVLRLFNQIAPARKAVLGTISNPFQEEVIYSSGRPFFTTNTTVFLVDILTPDAVKQLVLNLDQNSDFFIRGPVGQISDSACIYTTFVVGDKKLRVCSSRWISPIQMEKKDQSDSGIPDSIHIGEMALMDRTWYKNHDHQAMEQIVTGLLDNLGSQEH